MKIHFVAAFALLTVASSARADSGFLAGFEGIFGHGTNAIVAHANNFKGPHRDGWIAVSRAFGHLAARSVALLNKSGGVPGIDSAGYFKATSAAFLVGAIVHQLPFSGGLFRWLEQKTEDYIRRLSGLAQAIGSQTQAVANIRSYSQRIFGRIRAIAAGTVRYTPGAMSALVSDFDKYFAPIIGNLVRVGRAAPARAKAAFDRFFGDFIHSLVS